jgi:methylated-DNA-protein-cysteine methyltransferase-like protein
VSAVVKLHHGGRKVAQRKAMSKKNQDFFDKVYKIVAKIPKGKVTTYGAIAEVCGVKSAARTVGWALNSSKGMNIPAHRVVNRFGALTGKIHFGDPHLMKNLLVSEGVEFDENDCVNMGKYFWEPKEK